MTDNKVWLITGAGRGLGVDIAKAALRAGYRVVATGRDPAKVSAALGDHDRLLTFKLDVTRPQDAQAAVDAAVGRFGRIDVLVNNAGNFFAGFFEELSAEQFEAQLTTNLLGPLNVTRAVLPLMRTQRSGHVVTMSSTAGIAGQEFCSAYAASKFGLEGWMESLRYEVEPFGIHTTIVEPGFFRTDLLTKESTAYADLYGNCMTNETLPSLAFGLKSCSVKWKQVPQDQFLKGARRGPNARPPHPVWIDAQRRGQRIVKLIGYDCGPADVRRSKRLQRVAAPGG